MYYQLPMTSDPWQVFTLDATIDDEPFQPQIELRYLPAPDQWFISIWNHAAGELLVNQIPVICSYESVNDLLAPFRHLRDGLGLGSLFCLRNIDSPSTTNPSAGNLQEFQLIYGDTYGNT